MWKVIIFTLLTVLVCSTQPLGISNSAYRDVVIEIQDTVPVEQCAQILTDLEVNVCLISRLSLKIQIQSASQVALSHHLLQ